MPRWLPTLLALCAVTAAVVLAIARPGALSRGDAATTGVPVAVADLEPTATPWAWIDKNINNGNGPCDPNAIDSITTEYVGTPHKMGVCVGNLTQSVASFNLSISYDGALDQCVEEECVIPNGLHASRVGYCLDDNPDANTGATTWGPPLPGDWDCSGVVGAGVHDLIVDGQEPMCDLPDHATSARVAGITCLRMDLVSPAADFSTLGTVPSEMLLAVLDLNVIAPGTDNVEIQWLTVGGSEGPIGYCSSGAYVASSSTPPMPCQGATDIKRERHRPTPTPSPAPTDTPRPPTPVPPTATVPPPPPATPTPFGGAGPLLQPPATGDGGLLP